MHWTIEKMTELGVTEITPLLGHRTTRTANHNRLQRLIIAACEQCGRNRLPTLHPATPLTQWAEKSATTDTPRHHLSPNAPAPLTITPAPHHTLAIGPESGFTQKEQTHLNTCGFTPAHLGPRTLRTETAALVALALINAPR